MMNTEIKNALLQTYKEHPAMQLQDCIKFLYQRILGGEHLLSDADRCFRYIKEEKEAIGTAYDATPIEDIGGGYCRFHLLPLSDDIETLRTVCKLFEASVNIINALSDSELKQKAFLDALESLISMIKKGELPYEYESSQQFLDIYKKKGCPAIHHSEAYREAYHPAYRLMLTAYANFFPLFVQLNTLLSQKNHVVLAIDGKCGSGKSTLAELLNQMYDCNIIHMDDFFLPAELRKPERFKEAGGNVHYERFEEEVLPALKALKADTYTQEASYRIFDCHAMNYVQTGEIKPLPLTIIEGSYSMRPSFRDAYDCSVFLDIDPSLQKERLLRRNGEEAYKNFKSKWIPMENNYFESEKISSYCDLVFH